MSFCRTLLRRWSRDTRRRSGGGPVELMCGMTMARAVSSKSYLAPHPPPFAPNYLFILTPSSSRVYQNVQTPPRILDPRHS